MKVSMSVVVLAGAAFATAVFPGVSQSGVIYASGQLLIPGDPTLPPGTPGHDDSRENYVYAIDTNTGIATPVSPVTTGLPAALAGTRDGQLLGFSGGVLSHIDPATAVRTPIGANNGLNTTAFEVLPGGPGYILPFNANFETQQLHRLNLSNANAIPVGGPTTIGDAIDAASGNPPGTSEPFVISLGAVGNMLFGIDLDSNSLIAIDPTSGAATVVGAVGAVDAIGGGAYGGYAALTGVDENDDGVFDALFGAVNFFDNGTETVRLGGVARFDLADGSWSLIGSNPGVIFFGFGSSPVAAPGMVGLFSLMLIGLLVRRRPGSRVR